MSFRRPDARQAAIASVALVVAGIGLAVLSYLTAPLWTFLVVGNPELASPDGGVTLVVDVNGDEIARVATAVDFTTLQGEIPVTVERVVLGTEDRRFYEHNGVDIRGLSRAIVANLRGLPVQGGSTVTQQLVRNETGVGTERTANRKVREMLHAWRLEGMQDKRWILRRYLDTVWLGDGIRGVESAAYAWYRKPASRLTLGEAAMISAALPCPEACNPLSHPRIAETRRQRVLDALTASGVISRAESDAARDPSPVFDAPERVTTGDRWVLDTVRRELVARGVTGFDGGGWPGGLTIKTTIDLTAQRSATDAVRDVLGDPAVEDADVEASAVLIDPSTGGVRAVVGGRDFNNRQVNSAIGVRGAGSGRQGGSTAKVFALVAALESGYTATSTFNAPAAVQVGTKPVRNYDGRAWGRITLDSATRWSVDTAYVDVTRSVTPEKLAETAARFGLQWPSDVDERAVIGVHSTDPMQMASVMATLANDGVRIEPHVVTTVERDQRLIFLARPAETRVVAPRVAEAALSILRGVVINGTGGRAAVGVRDASGTYVNVPVAGKTGTTDNHADAWFVGTAPTLAGAVWIGNPVGSVGLTDVAGFGRPSGGGVPAKIFSAMMTGALEGTDIGDFPRAPARRPVNPQPTTAPSPETVVTPEETLEPAGEPTTGPTASPTVEPSQTPSDGPTTGGTGVDGAAEAPDGTPAQSSTS